jgi:putative phosphoesterase
MRIRFKHVIQGNHDRAVVTGDTSWFGGDASAAVKWTRKVISGLNLKFLSTRKDKERLNIDGKHFLMCHGAPWDRDEYILASQVDEDMLRENRIDILIMGHTHIPFVKKYSTGIVINPGSVGQPRDGDPRAAGAMLDTETMEVTKLRVDYDIDVVADAIIAKGLPETLAQRLSYGV